MSDLLLFFIGCAMGYAAKCAADMIISDKDDSKEQLKLIILKLNEMSVKSDKILADVASTKESVGVVAVQTSNIAEDLKRIAGTITGGLTEAEADVVSAEVQTLAESAKAAADALTVIANLNPEPTLEV